MHVIIARRAFCKIQRLISLFLTLDRVLVGTQPVAGQKPIIGNNIQG
jgi:hypothetical protein